MCRLDFVGSFPKACTGMMNNYLSLGPEVVASLCISLNSVVGDFCICTRFSCYGCTVAFAPEAL